MYIKKNAASITIVCLATLACVLVVCFLQMIGLCELKLIKCYQPFEPPYIAFVYYHFFMHWMWLVPVISLLFGIVLILFGRNNWQAYAIYFLVLANLCIFWIGFACLAIWFTHFAGILIDYSQQNFINRSI